MENHKCWPARRGNYLRKSYEAYHRDENLESIFYESKALCIGYLSTNVDYNSGGRVTISDDAIAEISAIKREDNNVLLNYITNEFLKTGITKNGNNTKLNNNENSNENINENLINVTTQDLQRHVDELLKKCSMFNFQRGSQEFPTISALQAEAIQSLQCLIG